MSTGLSKGEPRRIYGLHAIEDELGFSVETTGGNCTALSREFGEWTVQITADADGNAPTTEEEPVTIFLYSTTGPRGQSRFANAEEARMWLVELEAFVEDRVHRGEPDQFGWDFPEDAG